MAGQTFDYSATSDSILLESPHPSNSTHDLAETTQALQDMTVTRGEMQEDEGEEGSERMMKDDIAGHGEATHGEQGVMDNTNGIGRVEMNGSESAGTLSQMRSLDDTVHADDFVSKANSAGTKLSPEQVEARALELYEDLMKNGDPELKRALLAFADAVEGWSVEAVHAEFQKIKWLQQNRNI